MRALAAGLIVAVAATGAVGSAVQAAPPTQKENCTWHRHSKRVFKHVKRHGEVRRVKRVKHWWTCDRRPSPSAPGGGSAGVPTSPAPGEEPASPVARLSVKAVEWSYTLSRPEVSAGEAIVELNNLGEDSHNLKLQRNGSGEAPLAVPEAASGERSSARLALSPGSYRLYCSLFQHEEKGMEATLLVAASG